MLLIVGLIVAIYAIARLIIMAIEFDGSSPTSQAKQGVVVAASVVIVALVIWLLTQAQNIEDALTPFAALN